MAAMVNQPDAAALGLKRVVCAPHVFEEAAAYDFPLAILKLSWRRPTLSFVALRT
jgi:hypothetical protein